MIVFADRSDLVCPRYRLDELAKRLSTLEKRSEEITSHAALASLFIDAAELAQGICDSEFERLGKDTASPLHEAAMSSVMMLARAVHTSWRRGPGAPFVLPDLPFANLTRHKLPETVHCRRAEGYAYYAVYPECYLAAAKDLETCASLQIIGIRSIGLGLAALVAVATNANIALSLRPVGHPFHREILVDSAVAALLFKEPGTTQFAIADEGPGLSGSSFGAVIDFLTAHGVPEQNIHLFPSHPGEPGCAASENQQSRWKRLHRHIGDFETEILEPQNRIRRLDHWFSDVIGEPLSPAQDISAGRWRALKYRDPGDWPPAHVQQERRKYLLETRSGRWLLKFIGLDRCGRGKFALARALYEAGFGPEPIAARHGFIVERWWQAASPAVLTERQRLIERLALYLGFRARHFVVGSGHGASLDKLADMLVHNAAKSLGAAAAGPLERFRRMCQPLSVKVTPVATDNRLHRWEWIIRDDGSILKTDAIDHCSAHDLIGCQDIAWDIAGAIIEFDFSSPESEDLSARVQNICGRTVSRELIDALLPCYLAFQLGYYSLAAGTAVSDAADAQRLQARADHYRGRLRAMLV
jgi:hypothetical protein